jgi:hypothetical protein
MIVERIDPPTMLDRSRHSFKRFGLGRRLIPIVHANVMICIGDFFVSFMAHEIYRE